MYNRQDVFKKHIQKKAEELNELCKQLGVVSFMSFAVKDCDNDNPDLDNYMDDIDDENDAKYLEEIKK